VDRQKFYGVTIHQTDVFEIKSQRIVFLFQQCFEHVHVVSCKSSTNAQRHATLSDRLAVDFAGHCKRLSGIASDIASLESKLLATCNLLKTTGRQNSLAGADLANHANFANSAILIAI